MYTPTPVANMYEVLFTYEKPLLDKTEVQRIQCTEALKVLMKIMASCVYLSIITETNNIALCSFCRHVFARN